MITAEQRNNALALVEALKSGEYKQGKQKLCKIGEDQSSYCCFGVACEVAIKRGYQFSTRDIGGHRGYSTEGEPDVRFSLPPPFAMRKIYGFIDNTGTLPPTSLVSLNDDGVPFDEIAQRIEQEIDNPKSLLFDNI